MRYVRFLAASLLLGALAGTPDQCSANGFGGYGGYYGPGLYGYGLGIGQLYRSLDFPLDRRVPYFAARPPVYYSAPVPRTYGHSPFAYGPWAHTPEFVEPLEVKNPHAREASSEGVVDTSDGAVAERTISTRTQLEVYEHAPLTIINPFVQQETEQAVFH